MPIPVLVAIDLTADRLTRLQTEDFELHIAPRGPERDAVVKSSGDRIRAVLTNGLTGFDAGEIAQLPNLEIICAIGAGYEKIDLATAKARGIVVTNGAGTNDAAVADHTMMLLLAIARGVVQADTAVRRGNWVLARQPRPMISGKKLGILGMGNIGRQIAQRGADGFGMAIAYHNRTPRDGSPWLYLPSPAALAAWSDFMVIVTPGGAATAHLVDAAVLDALGPDGFLINVARGSVVDTAALIDALTQKRIGGAALDVIDGEPHVPSELVALDNVIITPHIAGRAPEAMRATITLVIENLHAHFNGRPVLTPVTL